MVRGTTNNAIDTEPIDRYFMVTNYRNSYDYPDGLKNMKELVTPLSMLTGKIGAGKNNVTMIQLMLFKGPFPKFRDTDSANRFATLESVKRGK